MFRFHPRQKRFTPDPKPAQLSTEKKGEIKSQGISTAQKSLDDGIRANRQQKYGEAESRLQPAYDCFKDTNDTLGWYNAAFFRGINCMALKRYQEAETYLAEAETLARELKHSSHIAMSTFRHGVNLKYLGRNDEAISKLETAAHQAFEISSQALDISKDKAIFKETEGVAYFHLGELYHFQGQEQKSFACFEKSSLSLSSGTPESKTSQKYLNALDVIQESSKKRPAPMTEDEENEARSPKRPRRSST